MEIFYKIFVLQHIYEKMEMELSSSEKIVFSKFIDLMEQDLHK